jgi:hypothetical protein
MIQLCINPDCRKRLFDSDMCEVEIICHKCKTKQKIKYISQRALTELDNYSYTENSTAYRVPLSARRQLFK